MSYIGQARRKRGAVLGHVKSVEAASWLAVDTMIACTDDETVFWVDCVAKPSANGGHAPSANPRVSGCLVGEAFVREEVVLRLRGPSATDQWQTAILNRAS